MSDVIVGRWEIGDRRWGMFVDVYDYVYGSVKNQGDKLGRPLPMEVAATFVKSGLPMFD